MAISCCGKKIPIMLLIAVVLIPAVLWFIWFSAAALLMNKQTVELGLQQLSAQLAEAGNEYNQNMKLTYGNVEIIGWGYKKQAIIHDVALDISGKTVPPMKFKFSTENTTVSLDPLNPKHLIVAFAKPVDLYQNDYSIGSLVFSEPLLVSYMQVDVESSKGNKYDIIFPLQIGMAPSKLIPSADVKENIYSVNFHFYRTL